MSYLSRLAHQVAIRELLYWTYHGSIGVQGSWANPHRIPLPYVDARIVLEVTRYNWLERIKNSVLDAPRQSRMYKVASEPVGGRLTIAPKEVWHAIP